MVLISRKRLPVWLRRSLPISSAEKTHEILGRYRLNTVCESASCPNCSECYACRTATFMILGNTCTRRCGFCAIRTGKGEPVEADEPRRVALAACEMGLKYAVVTSVARDDLEDEGAGHYVRTLHELRKEIRGISIEVLVPDFHARRELIAQVIAARPTVYNHNLETVRRLQRKLRPQAAYERSLKVLEIVKDLDPEMTTKSGLMLGLSETGEEIYETARDLRSVGCDILTVGQYLAPGYDAVKVESFVSPEFFRGIAEALKSLGFREVFAGPYVRSSYHASETYFGKDSEDSVKENARHSSIGG